MDITALDWAVLIAYLIIVTAIGLIVGYRVRHSADYFLGGRRFGPWLMIAQSFGVGTHAEMPVALAGAVYSVGASAIWFQWKNLFITPFYWIMAPVFRRIRRTTMAEFTEDRYGPWMGATYTVFALCFFVINTSSMLKGAGKVISQATGDTVGVNEIVVAMTVMFMLYSFVGGLVAAAGPISFRACSSSSSRSCSFRSAGAWSADGMQASLEPFRFSLTPSGIGPWVIIMLTVNGLVGIMAQPHQLAAVGTGRDERTCRVGDVVRQPRQARLHRGVGARGIDRGRDDCAGPRRRGDAPGPGERVRLRLSTAPVSGGPRIADRVGAGREHVDVLRLPGRQRRAVHRGTYRRRLVPNRPDHHYLWVGRISGLAVTMIGVVYALFLVESVLYTFLLTETLATFVGVSVVGGVVWRRANRWSAREPARCADDELRALPSHGPAARLLGPQRVSRGPPRRDCCTGDRQSGDRPRAGRRDGVIVRAATSSDDNAERPLLLVHLLHLRRAGGLAAFREDLSGFAFGWLIVLVLVGATAMFLAM